MSEESDVQREMAQNNVNLETAKSLGRIEGNIETIMRSQTATFKLLEQHDLRIKATESTLGNIKIKIAVASAIVSAFVYAGAQWLWDRFTKNV